VLLKNTVAVFFVFVYGISPVHALEDFVGKMIPENLNPQRVVALMPALAEVVVDLGAAPILIGVPDATQGFLPSTIVKLGPYTQISSEAVLNLKPDLVFASMDGNSPSLVKQIEKFGVSVVTINTQSLSDIVRSFEMMSFALGKKGFSKIEEFKNTLQKFKNPLKKNAPSNQKKWRIFVQIGWEPLVSIGKNTFLHELIELARGENLFANSKLKYPRPSIEEVIKANPDVILICPLHKKDFSEKSTKFWKKFKNMNAVRHDRIYVLPEGLLTKPTFSLLQGLGKLQQILGAL